MTKKITISLQISAPKGMSARSIRREVLTRINEVTGHFNASSIGLPDEDESGYGYLKLRASLAKERAISEGPAHDQRQ